MLRASLSIGASCSIGDVACQLLTGRSDLDPRRTAAFAASGLVVLGPVSYGILSTMTALVPGSSTSAILRRVLAVQIVEPLRIGIFLPWPSLLSGSTTESALEKVICDTLPTTLRSWCVFTPVLFVSFRYLRPENRVPLLASVGACWNTYLSWVANRGRTASATVA